MKNPIKILRADHCVNCSTDRAIECYDVYGKPMNYTLMLDTNNFSSLDKREVDTMRCRKCGITYDIEWMDKIPKPITHSIFMDIFINDIFKGGK